MKPTAKTTPMPLHAVLEGHTRALFETAARLNVAIASGDEDDAHTHSVMFSELLGEVETLWCILWRTAARTGALR